MPMKIKVIPILLSFLMILSLSLPVTAGKLSDFEQSATKEKNDKHSRNHGHDDDNGSFLGDIFGGILSFIVENLGQMSAARAWGSKEPAFRDIPLREKGSPDLPIFRFDMNVQHVNSNLWGIDGRIEAGAGPVGFQFRQTHYMEKSPKDTMDIMEAHGLFRISGSEVFELDAGIGALIIQGDGQHSGVSTTCAVNIYPHKNIGIRLAPTWSYINDNPIGDYDASIAYVRPFFSVRAGFRRNQTRENIIQGPYAGFSIHY